MLRTIEPRGNLQKPTKQNGNKTNNTGYTPSPLVRHPLIRDESLDFNSKSYQKLTVLGNNDNVDNALPYKPFCGPGGGGGGLIGGAIYLHKINAGFLIST